MKRSISMSLAALVGALAFAALGSGCSAADGGIDTAADSNGTQATSTAELRHHRAHSSSTTTTNTTSTSTAATSTAATSTAATSTAPTSTAPTSTPTTSDASATIAAAQTADGAAIPQAAGPGGVCPNVVVLLGFWSCPELDQTCSFSKDGAAHDCVCTRTDGEGQFPTWVCR